MTDAQIDVMVRLNTAIGALHSAHKLAIQYGWPAECTMKITDVIVQTIAIQKEITAEQE